MIFVTVGTHEQQFDRLVRKIDELKINNIINDEVFIQTGYSTYVPQKCKWKKLLTYAEMVEYITKSDTVITHGGPGSIFLAIQHGRVPIVVPRNPNFLEHVDEHQIKFVKRLETDGRVVAIYDIDTLADAIFDYRTKKHSLEGYNNNNLNNFISKLGNACDELYKKRMKKILNRKQ